ncbi:MAG: thioredoxin domain-containing protein [Candidatus Competibacteraceae bacterium]
MSDKVHTNHLRNETSPYLLQHAHNPVDWYPWGEEALARARAENKPILLSIGYSACHWCHVMAHESFEDEATARMMNACFINIKVDREERPDLDKIYQTAYQLLNGRGGGWPLTMFLTPDDQVPFLGGTYFPKEPRYGMPAFKDLLAGIHSYYRDHEAEVRRQNSSLLKALQAGPLSGTKTDYTLNPTPVREARDQLVAGCDPVYGGFGAAPKFPHPTHLELLLRQWAQTSIDGEPDREAETAALVTLRKMALGGIYDHLGGGFYRYSVDAQWMIPHFEKMLYDNGSLLCLYSEAWQATGEPLFKQVVAETAAWVIREMQAPEGGYYSSLDADSEGEEGKFYIWTPAAVRTLLNAAEYQVFAPYFGLEREANFESHWHLYVADDLEIVARRAGIEPDQAWQLLQSARHKLYQARLLRPGPGRDEKILTAWNGLMIKGMAVAGRHLERDDFIASAEQSLDFIRQQLWRDGRLLAVYKDGAAHLAGYLDDYALLLDGTMELLQLRWRDGELDFAIALAEVLLQHFQDTRKGGFYFTADDHESLIQRPKPVYDEALPAGNGIAARVLLKLGHLLGSMLYLEAAERTLKWAWPTLEQIPTACGALTLALEEYYQPAQIIVLQGPEDAIEPWRTRCLQAYAPDRFTLAIPSTAGPLPGILATRTPQSMPVAYLCSGGSCSPPLTSLEELEAALAVTEIRHPSR